MDLEATGTNIGDLGDEHGHRVLRAHGKGNRITLYHFPQQSDELSTAP